MNFFDKINPNRIPEGIDPNDTVQIIRERILQYILLSASSLGLIAMVTSVVSNLSRGRWELSGLYIIFYTALVYITYFRDRNYTLRANVTLSIFYILGLTGLLESGLSGDGRILLLTFAVMGTVLLKNIPWGWVVLFSVMTLGIIGLLMGTQIITPPPASITANSGYLIDWVTGSIIFAVLAFITSVTARSLSSGVESSLRNQRLLNEELAAEKAALENRVAERTEEIRRRALDLETAAEMASEIASSKDLENLLKLTVERVQSRFGFYHASIFLLDAKKEFAVLRASTGEAGKILLQSGHRLRVGEMGMVGYVVSRGEPRISSDVNQDPFHYKNPILPDTRSEITLPLHAGEEIIGALDIQSEKPGVFTPDDVKIFQIIADQLGVAIDKAKLVATLQDNLSLWETSTSQFTQKSWRAHLRPGKKTTSFQYRGNKIISGVPYTPEVIDAYRKQEPVRNLIIDPANSGEKTSIMAIPILLRGQILGVLTVKIQREAIADDLVEFLRSVTERLSVALENVRLLEEIQSNAERDHLVADISGRVRSATGVDQILRTAAEELGRTLGLSDVLVQLRPTDPTPTREGANQ